VRTNTRRLAYALLAVAVLGGAVVGGRASSRPRVDEPAVFAAALEAEIRFQGRSEPTSLAICIAIDPGGARQSASRELVARIKVPNRRLVRAAECEVRDADVIESPTGAPALYIVAGPVEWVAEDEAWVTITDVRTLARSMTKQYRVVRELDRWQALGQVFRVSPA
jgi:hypothetical protein